MDGSKESQTAEGVVEGELRARLAALQEENCELKAALKRVSAIAIQTIAMKNLAVQRLISKSGVEVEEKALRACVLANENDQRIQDKKAASRVPKATPGGFATAFAATSNEDTDAIVVSVDPVSGEFLPCIPVRVLPVSGPGDQDSPADLHRSTIQEAMI